MCDKTFNLILSVVILLIEQLIRALALFNHVSNVKNVFETNQATNIIPINKLITSHLQWGFKK